MKFATFAAAPPGQDRKKFQEWFVREYVPAIVAGAPTLRGGVVRRRVDAPAGAYAMDAATEATCGIAPYDVLLELWMSSLEDFRREIRPVEQRLHDIGSTFSSYSVLPRLQKDPRIAEAGPSGKRPEITFIIGMKWRSDVTAAYGQSEWHEHAAIALRAQPALTKYEQNVVTEVISWTPGKPVMDAFGDFSFRTVSDLVNKFIVTEEEVTDMSTCAGAFHTAYLGDAEPIG